MSTSRHAANAPHAEGLTGNVAGKTCSPANNAKLSSAISATNRRSQGLTSKARQLAMRNLTLWMTCDENLLPRWCDGNIRALKILNACPLTLPPWNL